MVMTGHCGKVIRKKIDLKKTEPRCETKTHRGGPVNGPAVEALFTTPLSLRKKGKKEGMQTHIATSKRIVWGDSRKRSGRKSNLRLGLYTGGAIGKRRTIREAYFSEGV